MSISVKGKTNVPTCTQSSELTSLEVKVKLAPPLSELHCPGSVSFSSPARTFSGIPESFTSSNKPTVTIQTLNQASQRLPATPSSSLHVQMITGWMNLSLTATCSWLKHLKPCEVLLHSSSLKQKENKCGFSFFFFVVKTRDQKPFFTSEF